MDDLAGLTWKDGEVWMSSQTLIEKMKEFVRLVIIT